MINYSATEVDLIFDQAMDQPSNGRTVFLDKACANNQELRNQVEKLLKVFDGMGSFLEDSAETVRDSLYANITTEWSEDNDHRLGTQIERYTIIKEIGRGGGSTVYEGHRQEEDWQQKSAIKILRRGLDTDDVLRRFHAERQILTHLNHPGIAAIHDAGITDDGLPWFAMELVEGENIADYCRTHQLSLKQRLRLFLSVLDVVKFAHQHLIVHRDIKPSNILVSNEGKVKLLDFGISKVLSASNEEILQTYTRTGVNPSTPNYASPEQITGSQITTATDIYQLGLLLCKILTGALPVATKNQSTSEDRVTPKKPSDLKDTVIDGKLTIVPSKQLKGDIDTIILKAIRFEPEGRYPSNDAFSNDICRFLENRPIEAQNPSLGYRVKKFFKRQPWALPVGLIATAGIAVYMITIGIYNEQLQEERDLKVIEAKRAEEIKSFLVEFLKAPDPYEGEGLDVTMKQALDNATIKVNSELSNNSELQIEMYATLAKVYQNLDLPKDVIELSNRQISLLEQTSATPAEILKVKQNRAEAVFLTQGKKQALKDLFLANDFYQKDSSQYLNELIETNNLIAKIELISGNLNKADTYINKSLALGNTNKQANQELFGQSLLLASEINLQKGDYNLALDLLKKGRIILTKIYGENTLRTIQISTKQADIMTVLAQDLEQVLAIYQSAAKKYKQRLGQTHSKTLSAISNSAVVLGRLKRNEEREATYRELLAIQKEKSQGKSTLEIAQNMSDLALALFSLNRLDEAEKMALASRSMLQEISEPNNIGFGYIDLSLGLIYREAKDYKKMEQASRRALDIFDSMMSRGNSVRETAQCRIGLALIRQNKMMRAKELLKDSINAIKKSKGSQRILNRCEKYLLMAIKK